jgi:hypothetical protein
VMGLLQRNPLSFATLDGIAFAAERGRLGSDLPAHIATDLGPLIEMVQLAHTGLLPLPSSADWLDLNGNESLLRVATGSSECWVSAHGSRLGAFRTKHGESNSSWASFRVEAHKAVLSAGFTSQTAARLIGAMGEIVDNVTEHSQAATTGLVAFNARRESFEFIVADAGVGALASLQTNSEYAHLRDEGDALQCALTDGETRFGRAAGRGTGFSQLFKSLATLNASLRFRSGDHALTIEGKSPTLINALVAKKPRAVGFFTSVRCTVSDRMKNVA